MNQLARWMMRLYPTQWRRRYGDELGALLTDTGADARVVADLLRGGVRMQFSAKSFGTLAVLLGTAGVLIAGAGSYLLPNHYVSEARLEVQHPDDVLAQLGPRLLGRTSLSSVINAPDLLLYRREQRTMPLEAVIAKMQTNIRFQASSASTIDIAFEYPDARIAQRTVATLIDRMSAELDLMPRLQGKLPARPGSGELDVVDSPNLAGSPIRSNIWLIVLTGSLLGASIPFARRKLKNRPLATWRFVASATAMALLGLFSAYGLAAFDRDQWGHHFVRDQYRSTAVISVQNLTAEQRQELLSHALSRTSLSGIIHDPRFLLYQDELKTKPDDDVIEKMHAGLSVWAINRNEHYFNISFEYPDRFKAQQAVWAVMGTIDEAKRAMAMSTRSTSLPLADLGQLSVLTPPTLDLAPVWPNRPVVAAIGGAFGVFLAALIALFRNPWKPENEIPMDSLNG